MCPSPLPNPRHTPVLSVSVWLTNQEPTDNATIIHIHWLLMILYYFNKLQVPEWVKQLKFLSPSAQKIPPQWFITSETHKKHNKTDQITCFWLISSGWIWRDIKYAGEEECRHNDRSIRFLAFKSNRSFKPLWSPSIVIKYYLGLASLQPHSPEGNVLTGG